MRRLSEVFQSYFRLNKKKSFIENLLAQPQSSTTVPHSDWREVLTSWVRCRHPLQSSTTSFDLGGVLTGDVFRRHNGFQYVVGEGTSVCLGYWPVTLPSPFSGLEKSLTLFRLSGRSTGGCGLLYISSVIWVE